MDSLRIDQIDCYISTLGLNEPTIKWLKEDILRPEYIEKNLFFQIVGQKAQAHNHVHLSPSISAQIRCDAFETFFCINTPAHNDLLKKFCLVVFK